MNLLTGVTNNALVKALPLQGSRSGLITKLLYTNAAIFGYYTYASGPKRLNIERNLIAGPESTGPAVFFTHFVHNSLSQLLFTSGVFYTLGNYHVLTYGCASFMNIFALSALGGSLLTFAGLRSGAINHTQAGAMAPAAGLIAYHVFKNPGWFKFLVGPIPALALLTLYGALYGDRNAIGGVSLGYLAFIFGL